MVKLIMVIGLVMIVLAAIGVHPARAQARLFEIHGEVKDEHGDVIVGAKVNLVGTQGSPRTVVTDGQGRWRFSGLAAGSYKLKASADGFSAAERTLISVLGAFSSGGAAGQTLQQEEWRMKFTDNLMITRGKHSLKLGAQIFGRHSDDAHTDNFNGTFVFGGGVAPELDANGRSVPRAGLINISGLEQYRRTLLGLPGGVPTRFSITRGNPAVTLS